MEYPVLKPVRGSSRVWVLLLLAALSAARCGPTPPGTGPVTAFEGALVITGDAGPPIPDGTLIVDGGRIRAVGPRGRVDVPPGAARVDLRGKTIIPALVDAHSHIGYMRGTTSGPANYTRENILDHLRRFAYHGVAASQAMGSDFGALPFEIRDDLRRGTEPDAARFLTAGRGLAPLSEIGPANMRHAAYAVTTAEGARAAVADLTARGVTIVKTWVDGRGGTVEKLPPVLYRAIIDEAHRRGARVAVHATELDDAKELLRAGVDIFAHMIARVDDELIALFKAHPASVVLPTLPAPRLAVYAPHLDPPAALLAETVPPAQIRRAIEQRARMTPAARTRAEQAWAALADGVVRLHAAGVTLGLGTDGGGQNGGFIGWTAHAELENLVAAGLSPADALIVATRNTARILGLDDLGTLAPGKSADLVILDASPLDDITNSRRIADVYLRGHRVDRAALRASFAGAMAP